MKIKITSPCMAMILYEAAKSSGQTEGGLLGETAQETTTSITDSVVSTKTEEVLSLHTVTQLPTTTLPKRDDDSSHCYGWFKFCRRPNLKLTVKEKSVHRKLVERCQVDGMKASQVVTLLVQETWIENLSTYTWKISPFILDEHRKFVSCKVEIVNLKAAVCGSYKPYPSIYQQRKLPDVMEAIDQLKLDLAPNNSFFIVETVRTAGSKVVKSLDDCAKLCTHTEHMLQLAYNEQSSLKTRLRELQERKEIKLLTEETESCSSDSTEEEPMDHESKAQELIQHLKDKSESSSPCTIKPCSTNVTNCLTSPEKVVKCKTAGKRRLETPPPKPSDPFDTLVDLAKAELLKPASNSSETANEQDAALLAEYNDERTWAERTRSGRKQLKNDE
ncbi:uncharacterized protein LOC100183524 [Ciona intestinalis]